MEEKEAVAEIPEWLRFITEQGYANLWIHV